MLHQLHSVGVCLSYVFQSLSHITEQLLAAIKAAANEFTPKYRTNPQGLQVDV